VYVCSTGLGVTNLIEQKMSEEISNLEIAGFASMLNVQDVLDETKPDLVISIFPMEHIDLPFIQVQPIPSKENIKTIQKEVNEIIKKKAGSLQPRIQPKRSNQDTLKVQEESKNLLINAYTVYQELSDLFQDRLIEDYKEAFLLHVMLMTHRIIFNEQYQENGNLKALDEQTFRAIKEIFEMKNLVINQAEISALGNYLSK